jgi:BlaI family transcriptional regulator, penicillinase repressor
MDKSQPQHPENLGELEQLIMDYIWASGPSTAEACRDALAAQWPMKDSTARTILRRLEEKGYLVHQVQGRTFIYRAVEKRQNVAARAVKHIMDNFCQGSVEQLLTGMVDNHVLAPRELERLARKIAQRKKERS